MEKSPHVPPSKNIVDTVSAAGVCNTLADCIQAAGLTGTLSAKGPFTFFAPTDAAFKKLAPGALDALRKDTRKLKAILSYHMIPGYVATTDVRAGEVMTLQGSTLTALLSPAGVQVNEAHLGATRNCRDERRRAPHRRRARAEALAIGCGRRLTLPRRAISGAAWNGLVRPCVRHTRGCRRRVRRRWGWRVLPAIR